MKEIGHREGMLLAQNDTIVAESEFELRQLVPETVSLTTMLVVGMNRERRHRGAWLCMLIPCLLSTLLPLSLEYILLL